MKRDYLITSDRTKHGTTEAILLSRTKEEAEQTLWRFRKANPGVRFGLKERSNA